MEAMRRWIEMPQSELETLLASTVFADNERVPLSSLPTVPPESIATPHSRCEAVVQRLEQEGLRTLQLDFSPPEQDEIAVVRAIVPGLEGETMSYGRLGERGARRLLERGERFVGRGQPSGSQLRVPLTAAAEERLGGPIWLDPELARERVGELYALYREPTSHAVQMGLERGFFDNAAT